MIIQKPYDLAHIPQDLARSSGQILAAEVHAVAGSKKRKRSEIALAIDREGVNVYDVAASVSQTASQSTDRRRRCDHRN